MKQLYFLNEEEKERILKLHKSHQVGKFWLNEQSINPLDSGKISDPTESMVIPPAGTWTASAQGDFKRLLEEYSPGKSNRWTWQKSVTKWCDENIYNNSLGPNSFPTNDLIRVTERVGRALEQGESSNLSLTHRGVTNATVQTFKNELLSLKNIPNFCHANKFKSRAHNSSGENLIEMFDEISNNQIFVTEIIGSLRTLAENTKGVTGGTGGTGGTSDAEWEKVQLEFYKTHPCLKDVAVASKAKNAIIVQNPSEHEQIIDQSQRKKTNITDKTTFMLDGTYITYTDAKANALSGKFQCSRDGELTLLYPGKVGMGGEDNIYSKFPCLGASRKGGTGLLPGTPYTEIDPSDNNKAIMDDEERKTHPIFSGYPKGDIYFSSDGNFQTEDDFNNDVDVSGRFKCKSKGRINAKPFIGASTEPIKPTSIVTPPDDKDKTKTTSGMGIVSISSSYISEILKCAKIGGSTLNQNALNQLYDYIKNNKK